MYGIYASDNIQQRHHAGFFTRFGYKMKNKAGKKNLKLYVLDFG